MKTQQGTFNDTAELKQNILFYIIKSVIMSTISLHEEMSLLSNNTILKL